MRSFTLDRAEPEPGVQVEQVQAEDFANLALDQGKPQCIKPPPLSFVYLYILFVILDCALGHRSWIDTLVALRLLSYLSLLILWLDIGP
jgi:hypothetical protein